MNLNMKRVMKIKKLQEQEEDDEEESDKTIEDVLRSWMIQYPSVPGYAVDTLIK